MRTGIASVVIILVSFTLAMGSEVREFDRQTIERLGRELTLTSKRPDRGATSAVRKRARETATAALRGRLFDIRYDYTVVDDPDGAGFLVYALGLTRKPSDVVLGGHVRVTVAANGEKVERIDRLSQTLMISNERSGGGLPTGSKATGMYFNQIVSNRPVETLIYSSNLAKKPIFVAHLTVKSGGSQVAGFRLIRRIQAPTAKPPPHIKPWDDEPAWRDR